MERTIIGTFKLNGYDIKLLDKYETNIIGQGGYTVEAYTPHGDYGMNYQYLHEAIHFFDKLKLEAFNFNVKLS